MGTHRMVIFLAGAAVGAAGMAFATSPKGKQIISDVIQGGAGLKESVAAHMETLKEDLEDYVAETRFKKEAGKKTEEDLGPEETAAEDAEPSADTA